MACANAIAVTTSSDAAEFVHKLGQQAEYEQIVEFVSQLPGVVALKVSLAPDPEGEEDPCILLDAYFPPHSDVFQPTGEYWERWSRWMIASYSPDVMRNFMLMPISGAPNEP